MLKLLLDNLRYKIAFRFLEKAREYTEKGDVKSVIKGVNLLRLAIEVIPPSKEVTEAMNRWKEDFIDSQRILEQES